MKLEAEDLLQKVPQKWVETFTIPVENGKTETLWFTYCEKHKINSSWKISDSNSA